MPSNDEEYQKRYNREWYKENKETHKKVCSLNRKKKVQENGQKILSYLREHPCVDCGEDDVVVLQFDHVRGKKRNEVGNLRACSWKTIWKEIKKCVVRCANCHTRRTLKKLKSYRVFRG